MARTADQAAPKTRRALSQDLLNDLSPEEFNEEYQRLAAMQAMTPAMRARLRTRLIERLKTPVDKPSWGPDWVRQGERVAGHKQTTQSWFSRLTQRKKPVSETEDQPRERVWSDSDEEEATIIARNLEKSRQVAHYRWLYLIALVLSILVVAISMFVDYHIIREVWTRALANEFMIVPPALQASVMFKSLQVIFAVLIVHFMLKISGEGGKRLMIFASFVLAVLMIAGLGYIVAYSNMAGGTAAAHEQITTVSPQQNNAIDQLFAAEDRRAGVQPIAMAPAPQRTGSTTDGVSLGLPKLSETSLAHAESWFWLAFASVVFFIVTTVAALYMLSVENNARNIRIADDYKKRCKDFVLLHLLELEDSKR